MPGDIVLQCVECGGQTRYIEAKYEGQRLSLNHKPDCSQQSSANPRLYLTKSRP